MKNCSKCQRELPLEVFHKHKRRKDGLSYECRDCANSRSKAWKTNHPTYQRERTKKQGMFLSWANNVIYNHRQRKIEILCDADDLAQKAQSTISCEICQRTLSWGTVNTDLSPTFDNRDCLSTIRLDQCLILCNQCNRTKSNRTLDEFVIYCHEVINQFNEVTSHGYCK